VRDADRSRRPRTRLCCPLETTPLRFAPIGARVEEVRSLQQLVNGSGLTLNDCRLVVERPGPLPVSVGGLPINAA